MSARSAGLQARISIVAVGSDFGRLFRTPLADKPKVTDRVDGIGQRVASVAILRARCGTNMRSCTTDKSERALSAAGTLTTDALRPGLDPRCRRATAGPAAECSRAHGYMKRSSPARA